MAVVDRDDDVVVERRRRRRARPRRREPTAQLAACGPGSLERGTRSSRTRPSTGGATASPRSSASRRSSSASSSSRRVGHLDVDAHEQVAAPAPAQRRARPAPLSRNTWPGLRAGRDVELRAAPSSVATSSTAPSAAWVDRHRRTCDQVVALALEVGMRRDPHGDVEVAGRPATRRGRARGRRAGAAARRRRRRAPRRRSSGCAMHAAVAAAVAALREDAPPGAVAHARTATAVMIWPRIERRTWRTSPLPPHTSQRVGMGPGLAPGAVAPGALDTGSRASMVWVTPNAASASVELDHAPRRRRRASGPPGRVGVPNGSPPKNASKRSPKPNVVAVRTAAAARSLARRRTRRNGDGARDRAAPRRRRVTSLNRSSASGSGVGVGVVAAGQLAVRALDLVVGRVAARRPSTS